MFSSFPTIPVFIQNYELYKMLLLCLFQDDAERLLKNCKRYDLLNDFYQNAGEWGKVWYLGIHFPVQLL